MEAEVRLSGCVGILLAPGDEGGDNWFKHNVSKGLEFMFGFIILLLLSCPSEYATKSSQ